MRSERTSRSRCLSPIGFLGTVIAVWVTSAVAPGCSSSETATATSSGGSAGVQIAGGGAGDIGGAGGAIAGSGGAAGDGGPSGAGGASGALVGGAGTIDGGGGIAGGGGITGAGGAAGAGGSTVVCTGNACAVPPSARKTMNLGDTPWKFGMQNPTGAETVAFNDSAWPDVGIPHNWNDVNSFVNNTSGGWTGTGNPVTSGNNWYRKHFKLDATYADKKILVEFEGAHVGARVFINGTFIPGTSSVNPQATHVIGFTPFLVDITDKVKLDGSDNVLAVNVAMNAPWFTSPGFATVFRFGQDGGGLFRPVWMHVTNKVHIPENVYAILKTWGTYVNTVSASATSAAIKIQTNVQNETAAAQNVTLTSEIVDATGNAVVAVEGTQSIAAGTTYLFDQDATVPNPTLWFPNTSTFGRPYLYKVFHIVKVAGAVVDTFVSPLGIRTLTWDTDFPYFNGQKHYLWGASSRYDYPALGTAVPDEQQWRDIKLAADGGCALWRPGHSTSSPEFVDACDAYGVMVVQPSGEGEGAFSTNFITDYKKALKTEIHQEMIVRDRNHPSILSWEANNGAMDTPFAQSLKALSKVWDPIQTRAQADRTPDSANGDILGCTLNGCELLVKSQHPNNPAWGSEYWGKMSARFAYDFEIAHAAEFINNWRKSRAASAFGIAQWYWAETVGENGNYLEGKTAAETRSVGSSMMDFSRIPKFLYYVYKAAWWPYTLKPVVALAHHWNRSGNVRVNAMSNCPKVRLSINGTVVGEKAPNPWNSDCSKDIAGANYAVTAQASTLLPNQVSWDVTWAAGTLKAECLNASGTVVASDQKVTAGAADHIVLTVEPPLVKPSGEAFVIKANGSDAGFVLATIVDKDGVWVPTANNNVTFAVTGPGNYRGGSDQYVTAGKPVSFHSPLDPELQAEGGMCKVAVRSTFAPGTVTVTAASPGLGQGAATFTTIAP